MAEADLRPITAYDLVGIRDIGDLSASPDGDYVAFQVQTPDVEARAYQLSWWIVETRPGGRIWEVSDGGQVILNKDGKPEPVGVRFPGRAHWSADSQWIYYLKRLDGDTQIWRSAVRDGPGERFSEQLTHHAGDILSFTLADDGAVIFFTAARPKGLASKELQEEADRGFLYDARFNALKRTTPYSRVCGINGFGNVREVGLQRACTPPIWVYDISERAESRASSEEVVANMETATETSYWQTDSDRYVLDERGDGSAIVLVNEAPDRFPGFAPPLRLLASLKDKMIRCNANECYGYKGIVEDAWWRPGRNEVIFLRADGTNKSMSGLYSWVPETGKVKTIVEVEDKIADCQVLDERAFCLLAQWTHPSMVASIDMEDGTIETIYDPNPEFDGIELSRIEKIEWEDQFGNPTHGHLVYPLKYERGRRYPLVITTYRARGFLRGATGDEYPIHLLAANGLMVLSHDMPWPILRYATAPEALRAQFEGNYERRSSLSAQEEILDMLDKRGLIDPARVAITGLSDGEQQVLFALTHTSHFATAIASGARDYRTLYYFYNQSEREFWRRVLGGTPDHDREGLYKALSVGLNAEKVNAPLLINVSDQELIASVESVARLQDAGKFVEMYVYPGEYHIKWQPQHRLAIYRRNLQWLKFWLLGEEEDEPVSRSQYTRWREMRARQCIGNVAESVPWYCRKKNSA